jgi:hypothetical protein
MDGHREKQWSQNLKTDPCFFPGQLPGAHQLSWSLIENFDSPKLPGENLYLMGV